MKHPIQPLKTETNGRFRFKANAIVVYLLKNGGTDMTAIQEMNFSQEDREQFAQLIGLSLDGFSELKYVSNETYTAAHRMATLGETPEQAQIAALEISLKNAQDELQKALHPTKKGE